MDKTTSKEKLFELPKLLILDHDDFFESLSQILVFSPA